MFKKTSIGPSHHSKKYWNSSPESQFLCAIELLNDLINAWLLWILITLSNTYQNLNRAHICLYDSSGDYFLASYKLIELKKPYIFLVFLKKNLIFFIWDFLLVELSLIFTCIVIDYKTSVGMISSKQKPIVLTWTLTGSNLTTKIPRNNGIIQERFSEI